MFSSVCLKIHALKVSSNQIFVKCIIVLLKISRPNCILQERDNSNNVTDHDILMYCLGGEMS